MTYAAIRGWGKCLPPAVLSNADLATFLDTDDAWITSRTGIRERRISHVPALELAYVASARALACAGVASSDLDLIVYGSCSNDEHIPNSASGLQWKLAASKAAAMDVNTACTSFLYSLSTATALIRTGAIRTALVVGVEVIAPFMDWRNRNVSVLFGDGAAAVVLQADDAPTGLMGEALGCYADARQTLRVRGAGFIYGNGAVTLGDTIWDFDGQEIFKRAVHGMSEATIRVLAKCATPIDAIDVVVPHQANLRIIESVMKRVGAPMSRAFLTIERYGNMSAATVPVAMVEAIEAGRIAPDARVLMPAFGGGLTWCAHLVRWGERTRPLDDTTIDLPACNVSALDLVRGFMARVDPPNRSHAGLMAPRFPESSPGRTQ